VPIGECYFKSAKDKFLGFHHDLREVKRTPGMPKMSKTRLTGRE